MKCVVCGKNFSGESCPACQFPVVHFPGNPEEGMAAVKPQIEAYRAVFLSFVSVGVMTYTWKDQDGKLALQEKKELSFGGGNELYKNVRWLSQKFARVPEVESLKVDVVVHNKENVTRRVMQVPNLLDAQLQEVGIGINEDMSLQLYLRNENGVTKSEAESLFAD